VYRIILVNKKMKGRDQLRDLIIEIKMDLKEAGFFWLRIGSSGGLL
jgi:hypothetical protein